MAAFSAYLHGVAAAGGQRVGQGGVRVQGGALLVQRDLCEVGAQLHFSGVWLVHSGQHLQQRGLSRPIGADDAQPVAAQHAHCQILHHGHAVECPADVLGDCDQLAR